MSEKTPEAPETTPHDTFVRQKNTTTAQDLMPFIERDGLCFVPIEIMTAAIAFEALKMRCCKNCTGACEKCVITSLLNKLEDAVRLPPILDADANPIRYETDAEGNLVRDADGRPVRKPQDAPDAKGR